VAKYSAHLPLYRQAQIVVRNGIDLDRSTLANRVGAPTGGYTRRSNCCSARSCCRPRSSPTTRRCRCSIPGAAVRLEHRRAYYAAHQARRQQPSLRRFAWRGRKLAILASLIQTAKLNDVEPFAYLRDVLERVVAAKTRLAVLGVEGSTGPRLPSISDARGPIATLTCAASQKGSKLDADHPSAGETSTPKHMPTTRYRLGPLLRR
jgi:hypothetical protein